MKTPEQIGEKIIADHFYYIKNTAVAMSAIIMAIEADRAQRAEVHPDWMDDAKMIDDGDHVEVSWQVWSKHGRKMFESDMTLTAEQARGMFQGIGEETP